MFRLTFVIMTGILMIYWQVYKKFDKDDSAFHVSPIVMLVILVILYLWMYTLHPIPLQRFSGRYTLAT